MLSVEYCEEHLSKSRARAQRKKALSLPGSTEYLYAGDITPSDTGRYPGNAERLGIEQEKRTRRVLAELGIKPEDAAVTLRAAKDALLKVTPDSRDKAMTAYDLFHVAQIPTSAGRRSTTGYKALRELLSAGKIQRIGKARSGHPFRYFAAQGLGE